ncbi:MAG: hypothetical protein M3P30_15665 [Chloroflexota bacterium]|nr:hypothetical protein [Chloroflexota bacterium]
MELPEEPFDFSRLCREIGRGLSRLSPLLGALYLRQAICSNEDFLVPHDSEPLIEFQDLELWYACVFKILRVGYDYEPTLGEYLGLADQIDEINQIFSDASGALEHWTYGNGDRIDRLREICTDLSASARPIGEWVSAFDPSEMRSLLDSEPTGEAATYSEEQLQHGRRIVASRDLMAACFDLTNGRPRDALSRLGEEKWLYEWKIGGAGDELGDLLILRTSIVRAEARSAIGLDGFDEKSGSVLADWSTAFFSNWLDQRHSSAWAVEDSEEWQLDLDQWLNSNGTPYEGGLIGGHLRQDLLVRLAVLTRGSLRATPWLNPVDHVLTEEREVRTTSERAFQLLARMEPLLEPLRSMPERQDHLLDVMLDVRIDQRTVAEILTSAGENRVAAAKRLLRAAAPGWGSLDEESRRELLAAELEYRAYLSGDRLPEHAAAIAGLFSRPIEREYELWTRNRGRRGWPKEDPPNWNAFWKERGFAAHPDSFGEIDLTRMRSYLLGMYRGKDSLLQALALAAERRARR